MTNVPGATSLACMLTAGALMVPRISQAQTRHHSRPATTQPAAATPASTPATAPVAQPAAAPAQPITTPPADPAPAGTTTTTTTTTTTAPAPPANPAVVEARQHFDQGVVLFARENFDAALAEFQRAYELLQGNPHQYSVLFNIAQSNERLFRYDEALRFYQRYLEEGGAQAEDRVTVEANIRALDGLLATLHITTNVPSAEVWIDDRRVATAPGDIRVPGGRHTVQLRVQGYLPGQQEVQITARARRDLNFTLEHIPEPSGASPIFFYGASGLAVVSLAAGAVIGSIALSASNDAQRRYNEAPVLVSREEVAAYTQTALIADICFGAGALFAVGAGVLYFLTDFSDHPAATGEHPPAAAPTARLRLRPAPVLSPNAAGFGILGVF